MEPRARAGKNVGKMNFSHSELAQLLYAHGDIRNPLPDTVRVLDEILTDFMQSIAFEATRAAHYSGRQKIKYEDFEFAFRKNSAFLGKVQEVFEKQKEIKSAREILKEEDELVKDLAKEEKAKAASTAAAAAAASGAAPGDNGIGSGNAGVAGAGGLGAVGSVWSQLNGVNKDEELGEGDDDADAEVDIGRKT